MGPAALDLDTLLFGTYLFMQVTDEPITLPALAVGRVACSVEVVLTTA
jgi:hypothetical protein